eukprot:12348349-Alexandrium_andersonii.AAC.1
MRASTRAASWGSVNLSPERTFCSNFRAVARSSLFCAPAFACLLMCAPWPSVPCACVDFADNRAF